MFDYSSFKKRVGNFDLVIDDCEEKHGYLLFHYVNDHGWKWQAQYDKEVEDYTVKVEFPLFAFNDITFIRSDLSSFTEVLVERYESVIEKTLVNPANTFTYGFAQKKIPEWEYASFLPEAVGDFQLDIVPNKAICMINGSYIIAEYAMATEKSGLLLSYNVLRDEFFAELYKNSVPIITHELDVKSLEALEVALRTSLINLLEGLTKK